MNIRPGAPVEETTAQAAPRPSQQVAANRGAPIECEAEYTQTLSLMQQGLWREAGQALAALEHRYPGAAELGSARETLALHLSAERTWADTARPGVWVHALRGLLVANLLVYVLLGVLWLLASWGS